jgi:hypothetical protein
MQKPSFPNECWSTTSEYTNGAHSQDFDFQWQNVLEIAFGVECADGLLPVKQPGQAFDLFLGIRQGAFLLKPLLQPAGFIERGAFPIGFGVILSVAPLSAVTAGRVVLRMVGELEVNVPND